MDINNITSESIAAGDVLNFSYVGYPQSITLKSGVYKLECWGASGGSYQTDCGTPGGGGYASGTLTIVEDTTVYCFVGGEGISGQDAQTTKHDGGFNGGGYAYGRAGSGGGASDIRLRSDSLYSRVIVAGGGGGAQYTNSSNYHPSGGCGGGLIGGDGYYGTNNFQAYKCTGGSQTAPGQNSSNAGEFASVAGFGFGAGSGYYGKNYTSGGGGGGWYGGGVGRNYYAAGAGGSGYVYTPQSAVNYPDGCLLSADDYLNDAVLLDGDKSFASPSGVTETGHNGHGFIKITAVFIGEIIYHSIDINNTTDAVIKHCSSGMALDGADYLITINSDEPICITDNGEDITDQLKPLQSGYYEYIISNITEDHEIIIKPLKVIMTKVGGLWKAWKTAYKKVDGEWIRVEIDHVFENGKSYICGN